MREIDTNVSWSRLATFENCHQKSYLLSTAKNPARDARNTLAGNICDHAMKAWLEQENPEIGFMAANAKYFMSKIIKDSVENEDGVVRWRHASDRQDILDFSISVLTDLEQILVTEVLPYDYEVGKRFRTPIIIPYLDDDPCQIHLVGEFDLLTKRDGKFEVWDLKSTKDNSYWRKSLGQLIFYDLAVLAMYQLNTSKVGFIQPACKPKVLSFDISQDDRNAMLARIIRYCQGIWTKDNSPKVDKLSDCSMCPVRHACCRYKSYVDAKGNHRIPIRVEC